MLTLPVYRALPCETGAPLPARPFVVREATPVTPPKPRLLDRVRATLRARHYSRRTEEACVAWIKRDIFFFHAKRHPAEMGAPEVTRFLSSLAVDGRVAASTQNQALSALLFLYRDVLEVDLPWLDGVVRAKRSHRLPVVLTRDEVRALLQRLDRVPRLMACLLYGAGGSAYSSVAGSGRHSRASRGNGCPNTSASRWPSGDFPECPRSSP
jgi:integrase